MESQPQINKHWQWTSVAAQLMAFYYIVATATEKDRDNDQTIQYDSNETESAALKFDREWINCEWIW